MVGSAREFETKGDLFVKVRGDFENGGDEHCLVLPHVGRFVLE